MAQVQVQELRDWASSLFDAMEAQGVTGFEIEGQYYWQFESLDVWEGQPPEPLLGDTDDDLSDVRSDTARPLDERATYTWHTLDHLIGVLTAVSAELKRSAGIGRV